MIFVVTPMRGPHETAHRKIKSRGTELAFVVTFGTEIQYFMALMCMLHHISDNPIYLSITTTASFVGKITRVPDTRYHQPMLYVRHLVLISGEPGNGADRSRYEKKPVRISTRFLR